MGLKVVGAGVGRTGTHSLKLALEQLLGGPCYHMIEVFERPDDVPRWQRAFEGGDPGPWDEIFDGYVAAVDWPAGGMWKPISEAYPDALVLLSVRPVEAWFRSADATIFASMRRGSPPEMAAWQAMADAMVAAFAPGWPDPDALKAAYERHNAEVRATAPADRLLEWQPGDGWDPICAALGVPVPDAPFPHVNTTDEFRATAGLD